MQRFSFIGNICNDLALEETSSGKQRLKFGVAVKREYSRGDDGKQVDFFDCTAWGGTAKIIEKYCKKGEKIYIEGRIETNSYEDSQGIKRRAFNIVVDKVELLGVKKGFKDEEDMGDEHVERKSSKKAELYELDDTSDIPF